MRPGPRSGFYREEPGQRHGHSCVKVSPSSRAHRAKSCVRLVSVGRFKHKDRAGTVRFGFSGRVGGRTLRAATYLLKATAVLAREQSTTASAPFTILP
jgi:hypothetical protein